MKGGVGGRAKVKQREGRWDLEAKSVGLSEGHVVGADTSVCVTERERASSHGQIIQGLISYLKYEFRSHKSHQEVLSRDSWDQTCALG